MTNQIRIPKKRVPKKIIGFIIGISWPVFVSRLTPRSKILLNGVFKPVCLPPRIENTDILAIPIPVLWGYFRNFIIWHLKPLFYYLFIFYNNRLEHFVKRLSIDYLKQAFVTRVKLHISLWRFSNNRYNIINWVESWVVAIYAS